MRLEIVVAPDCPGCEDARALARQMDERFPSLEIDIIELDGQRKPPRAVFATPTYLLDGAVIFLGNPFPEQLVQALKRQGIAEGATGRSSNDC